MTDHPLDVDSSTADHGGYPLECYGCGYQGDIRTMGLGNDRQCPMCGSREVHSP